jgi:hypothetical protein
MQLTVHDVDYAPEELHEQTPIVVDLLRQIPGDDRPDYWLGAVQRPIRYMKDNRELSITHLILAARWVGTQIAPGVRNLPVGIAFVTDATLVEDERLDFQKCDYVAIGISSETSAGRGSRPPRSILAGTIGRGFGVGGKKR